MDIREIKIGPLWAEVTVLNIFREIMQQLVVGSYYGEFNPFASAERCFLTYAGCDTLH